MKTFITTYHLECLKKKFILLYILNVIDIIFTLLLLKTGYFEEVNLLMVKAVQHPLLSLIIKVIFPAILLTYVFRTIQHADDEQRKVSNIAVNISLSIYSFVNLSHVIWAALLPYLYLHYR